MMMMNQVKWIIWGVQFEINFSKNSSKELCTIKMFARRIQPFGNIIIIHFGIFCLPNNQLNPIQFKFHSIQFQTTSFCFDLYRSFAIVSA